MPNLVFDMSTSLLSSHIPTEEQKIVHHLNQYMKECLMIMLLFLYAYKIFVQRTWCISSKDRVICFLIL